MIEKKFYLHLWLLLLYIPFVFIVKDFLPQNIARENGPIENFQLVLLAVGVYLCWQAMKKTDIKNMINIFGRQVCCFIYYCSDGN